MEEQDKALISSLKSLGYPVTKETVPSEMEFEHLVECSKFFLEMNGEDANNLPKANQMKQRYKVASMLIDKLRAKGVQVQVTVLLSPTGPDIRNFLLSLLSKSEFGQDDEAKKKVLSLDERIELSRKQMNKKVLEDFVTSSWLHPKFRNFEYRKPRRFGGINPPFELDEGENFVDAIENEFPNANFIGVMSLITSGKAAGKKQRKIESKRRGVEKSNVEVVLEKNRKIFNHFNNLVQIAEVETPEIGFAEAGTLQPNVRVGILTNFNELEEAEEREEQAEKAQEKEGEEEEKEEEAGGLTIEELEEKRLEEFRVKKKEEMERLTSEVAEIKEKVAKIKTKALKTQERAEDNRKKVEQGEQDYIEMKKDLKNKESVLESLDADTGLEQKRETIKEMEEEVEDMRETWEEFREELEADLKQIKKSYEAKRTEIMAKEEKIDFYEENYGNLISESKREVRLRDKLIEEYKRMPKDMTREELSKMIFNIKKKSRKNEETSLDKLEELRDMEKSVGSHDKDLKMLNMEIAARIGEGENKKKKNDNSFDELRDAFRALGKVFKDTKKYMTQYGKVKAENGSLEERVDELKRKNYKETTDKLKKELANLG